MRLLILTRGVPSSGKSSWIKENGLEQYTLSADSIRLLYQGPIMNKEGDLAISQNNDKKVWKLLYEVLEDRMARGELTVIDATHYKSTLLNRYKELIKKYRYRVIIADFTDIPLETALTWNKSRDEFKKVPEHVIQKMHSVFKVDTEVNNRFTVVHRNEVVPFLKQNLVRDFNNYNKVVFIGDIHGCYEPLEKYFKDGLKEDTFYVFLGDYIDRGLQNKEVLEFLISIKDNKNVLLLEGNHENAGRLYAEGSTEGIRSSTFIKKTLPQIESIDKKELRQFYRKLGQLAYFQFGSKIYLATHGGVPNLPTIFTQTEDLIKGVGKYDEVSIIDENFVNNTPDMYVGIHGHRNIFMDEAEQFNGRVYNLNDKVEKGGHLRILEVTKDNVHTVVKIKNDVFDETLCVKEEKLKELPKTSNELIDSLNNDKDIVKKVLSNGVISYNFSRTVFSKGRWTDRTVRARGLFIDNKSSRIMGRSYEKSYNWSEQESTKSEVLKETLKFPVKAYRKENGFLGILSYDFNADELFICSKSTNQGDFADMFRELIKELDTELLLKYTKENNVSLVFEVINQEKDPHMIRYSENQVILLDIVRNEFDTEYLPYEEVTRLAESLKVPAKQLEYTFEDWDSLYAWRKHHKENNEVRHEGWMLVDDSGFMVKSKTLYYKFWKEMRKIKTTLENNRTPNKNFKSLEEVEVYKLMESLGAEQLKQQSIIDISELYYKNKKEQK